MSDLPLKDQMDYAMKHFLFLAEQRIKTFNFYIILFAALTAATITAIDRLPKKSSFLVCGVAHLTVAVIFWMMDSRSRRLIKLSLAGVRRVEMTEGWPANLRLANEDADSMSTKRNRTISYTGAFNIAFAVQSVFGVLVLICGLMFVGHSKPPGGQECIATNQTASTATNAAAPVAK